MNKNECAIWVRITSRAELKVSYRIYIKSTFNRFCSLKCVMDVNAFCLPVEIAINNCNFLYRKLAFLDCKNINLK